MRRILIFPSIKKLTFETMGNILRFCHAKMSQLCFSALFKDLENQSVKKHNFTYCVKPVYYISRAFGLMPFSLIYDSNEEIQSARVRLCDSLWFVLSICLNLFWAFMCYQDFKFPVTKNGTNVLLVAENVITILTLILNSGVIVMKMYNRFEIVEIWKNFAVFDKAVSVEKTYT